jgi:hypothetical protein
MPVAGWRHNEEAKRWVWNISFTELATLFPQGMFWTLTPALAPGASENADFADSKRKNPRFSAFICVPQLQSYQQPVRKSTGLIHQYSSRTTYQLDSGHIELSKILE